MVDLGINETRQTGAVKNRTYRAWGQCGAIGNRTYRGAKVSIYFEHLL